MPKKRTNNQSLYATPKEMKMIKFIKENTDANSNSAVLRKGLYHLYDQVKQREDSWNLESSLAEN